MSPTSRRLSLAYVPSTPRAWLEQAISAIYPAAGVLCRNHWQPVPVRIAHPVRRNERPKARA